MQSDFKSTWVFVSLSLISAIFNFLRRVTLQIRYSFWSRVVRALSCFHCCRRLHVYPWNTAHGRRLRADLAIQHMISEYSSLVLSQAFFIFYQFQNFEIATETLSLEFLKRIAIAFGIDFIFHCLSNCIEMYYYNFPIGRVWKKNTGNDTCWPIQFSCWLILHILTTISWPCFVHIFKNPCTSSRIVLFSNWRSAAREECLFVCCRVALECYDTYDTYIFRTLYILICPVNMLSLLYDHFYACLLCVNNLYVNNLTCNRLKLWKWWNTIRVTANNALYKLKCSVFP